MNAKPRQPGKSRRKGGRILTLTDLENQNRLFRGRGGVSEENRALGFRPAFYDMDSGIILPSRFANGREAPMHLLEGLPEDLIESRDDKGRPCAARAGIIAGFSRNGQFYTRDQAASATQQMKERSLLLSDPEQHEQLLDIWDAFMADHQLPLNLVRPVVAQSWIRCKDSGLDPSRADAPGSDEDELAYRQASNTELLDAAKPILKHARDALFRADSIMVLSDAQGLILEAEADKDVYSAAGRVNLIEGGQWSEYAVGTNAIGTAIAAQEPVQLYGAEHFCSGIKRWTCSADVIRDPHDGQILGAVDLSGLTDTYQHEALEFVITAARLVEANLAEHYFSQREDVIRCSKAAFSDWSKEGLLAFDRRGRLIRANQVSQKLMAAMDTPLAITPQTRVAALDLAINPALNHLPEWLLPHQLLDIRDGTRIIGTLVVLTQPH
ncbi:sigma-54-dependent Fis family transcriptional regulator [Marinobacterium mangrovicola]|uniref:GAF domain-containing protein n=1 Tax=Marinobacterium mangrovicola TaxID=1476959 RepID=A0A4R1GPN4_9GAMM|nr:GAF domain-containing protein [Marinobacterium mangrovicola]TCK08955.1 GAF domain-containing protein [Marinobacterium mangrovicola]